MADDLYSRFDEYEQWIEKAALSAYTKRNYLRSIREFLNYLKKSGIGFASINNDAILQYRNHLKHELTLAPSSVNNILAAIDHFFRFLNIAMPRTEREVRVKRAPKVFSTDEIEKFLKVVRCQSARDQAIVYLFLYAALWVGQCAAMNLEDVVLTAGGVMVMIGQRKRVTKREMHLDDVTAKAIADWIAKRREFFPDIRNHALFLNQTGGRLTTGGINFLVKSLGWKVGLEISPQKLRNTCLQSWVLNGHDLSCIAARAGHKCLDTTLRYTCANNT